MLATAGATGRRRSTRRRRGTCAARGISPQHPTPSSPCGCPASPRCTTRCPRAPRANQSPPTRRRRQGTAGRPTSRTCSLGPVTPGEALDPDPPHLAAALTGSPAPPLAPTQVRAKEQELLQASRRLPVRGARRTAAHRANARLGGLAPLHARLRHHCHQLGTCRGGAPFPLSTRHASRDVAAWTLDRQARAGAAREDFGCIVIRSIDTVYSMSVLPIVLLAP